MPLLTPTAPAAPAPASEASPPPESRAAWTRSFDLADHPVPTGREEAWRFTPLQRVRSLLSADAATDAAISVAVKAPALVKQGILAPGEGARGTALVPEDRASARAAASGAAPHVLIPENTQLNVPVTVTVTGQDTGTLSDHHLVIEAAPYSKGTVIVHHRGSGQHVGNVEIVVGRDAQLTVISVQEWKAGSVHLAQHSALVGSHATLQHIVATWGADVARLNTTVRYDGPGGEAELLGAFLAGAGQHLEHRSYVDHNAPHCTSNVLYKGALREPTARTVWVGDVLIRAAAEGTQTYELNRNLVLCDDAQADSVPNLEIETGQIRGAGHASATGRFDEEQLFYLMARGIPEDQARRMVVHGFFADIVHRVPDESLSRHIMASIDTALGFEPEAWDDEDAA